MRQFLVVALILLLVVALGGAITAGVVLYSEYQTVQQELEVNATRVAELEDEFGATETANFVREALAVYQARNLLRREP